MNIEKMQKIANQKMCERCNCCESVLWGYIESSENGKPTEALYKIASIFGGGVASSREEICGALTGALMVLSLQNGRTNGATSNDALMENGRAFRSSFIEKIGPTKCSELRDSLESKTGAVDCKKVVQDCIELLQMIEPKP